MVECSVTVEFGLICLLDTGRVLEPRKDRGAERISAKLIVRLGGIRCGNKNSLASYFFTGFLL